MVFVETNFPRGGTILKREETHINFGAKQEKRKKKNKVKNNDKIENETKIEAISAELLTYKTIQEGMLLYGIVKHVDSTCLSVSLPGRIVGKVYASSISDSYNKILKEFIEKSKPLDNFKTLDEMYKVGQHVYAKVIEIKENDMKTRIKVNLSLKPSDVHSNLFHEKIKKDMVLNGAIEEVQDHGYVIESGISNLRCFLPKQNIENVECESLNIGQLIFVKIVKLTQFHNASTAVCNFVNSLNNRKIKDLLEPQLDYLMPSTIVNFTITKILKDGLQGTLMNGNFTAYVNEHQLKDLFEMPTDYTINSKIAAKILYVMPLSKLVYLSLRIKNENIDEEDILKRGMVFNASVHSHGTGGIVFKIDDNKKAVMSLKYIKSKITGNFDQDNILSKYGKNSHHEIRIIDFDFVDNFYICSDEPDILKEKYFCLEDCKSGDFVTAILGDKNKETGTLYFRLGNCSALMEKIFQSPQTALTAVENGKVKCRILGINYERNIVYLTSRQEYMKPNAKILGDIKNAKIGFSYLGTIVKNTERFIVVKFFDEIRGILYKTGISGFETLDIESFSEGQTMLFTILKKKGKKLLLSLSNETFKIGEICKATVENYLETGLEISIKKENEQIIKGLIPFRLLTNFPDLNSLKLKTFVPKQSLDCVCILKNTFSLRDREYFESYPVKTFSSLQPGDILRGSIKNINDDVVEVFLPILNYNKLLRIHLKMILTNINENPNIIVEPDQLIYLRILRKDFYTKALTTSAKLIDVWSGSFEETGEIFAKYLSEIDIIKGNFKSRNEKIGSLEIGSVYNAVISFQMEETSDWYIELEEGVQGIIKKHLFEDKTKIENVYKENKVGDEIRVVILWVDYTNKLAYCTNHYTSFKKITSVKQLPENLIGKSGVEGKVLLNFPNFIICSLKANKSPIVFVPIRVHYNDFETSVTTDVQEGDFCKLNFVSPTYPIAVFADTMKLWTKFKEVKRLHIENQEAIRKKLRTSFNATNSQLSTEDKNEIKLEPDEDIYVNFEAELDSINQKKEIQKILESSNINSAKTSSNFSSLPLLPGVSDFWSVENEENSEFLAHNTNSDDSQDEEENKNKTKKRLTAAERFKAEKFEETRIREIENKYADLNSEPENADQFDRLVLSDPNNSKHWIKYMAYYIQSTEIDKARAVAKRAVKAISFREQQEIINVWIALLNLESNYGTKDNFNDILKEALLCNDPLQIYMRVLEILTEQKKILELTDVIATIIKKFKENPEVWKSAANAYFDVDMKEKGQQLLHRSLSVLPEREHVNTIVAFANINHKYGEKETAHTLMEQVLTSYSKRVDVWSQYVDMLVKDSLIEPARRTLERAVIQKIPLKKMRTLFKKYVEFEEKYGDATSVLKVKELAQNYVNNI